MDFSKYKYNPDDFKDVQFMSDDLTAFYVALEKYKADANKTNSYEVFDRFYDLHYTLKHRTLNGILSPSFAQEIEDYLLEVAND